jgi:DNA (cytosine-5)-methyltransferase 1
MPHQHAKTVRVLDLFSGIGGFSIGLERAGMRTVAFCEIDPHCQAVLRRHWPAVPVFSDVRDLYAFDFGPIDVICGGFPCQDISTSGKGAGLAGERSGLWFYFHGLVQTRRPRWAIIENVSALRSRGLDQVLRGLAEIGYDALWNCIPASAVGAPHQRDRIWIVAYPHERADERGIPQSIQRAIQEGVGRVRDQAPWAVEPGMERVADGVRNRVDRLRAIGNAVVPAIPEIIGKAIIEAEGVT